MQENGPIKQKNATGCLLMHSIGL